MGTRFGVVVTVAVALIYSLVGGNTASGASTVFWTAQNTMSMGVDTSGDELLDAVRPMFTDWGRSVHLSDGSVRWPVDIGLDTELDPTTIRTFPTAAPVRDGATSRYSWSLQTGDFTSVFRTIPTNANVGFDLSRELSGGRAIAAGAVERRHLTVRLLPTQEIAFYTIEISFVPRFGGPEPVLAVVPSDISCSPAQNLGSDPLRPFWSGTPTAEVRIDCDLTLTNTSTGPARYTPGVFGTQGRSSFVSLAAGAVNATHDDPVLGRTTYHVTPAAGVAPQGQITEFQHRYAALNWQNEGGAPPSDQPMPWSARYTENLQLFSSDNAVPDEIRPFEQSWQFSVSTPGWPASIRVDTALNTNGWFVFPEVEPLRSPTNTMYQWHGTGSASAILSSLGFNPETRVSTPASLGVSVAREAVGGTRMDAGATVQKSYVIRLVGTNDTTADVSAFILSGAAGTPNPITVTNQECEGARVLGGLPGGFAWTVTLPRGVEVRLNCTATLTNTASRPANYMPVVFVTRTTSTVQASQSASVVRFDSPPLGTVTFEVFPPAGQRTEATLTNVVEKSLFLGPLNRAPELTELTYVGATDGYYGEPVTLAARLNFTNGGSPVQSRTLRFEVGGASYTATTDAGGIARVELQAGLGAVGAHTVTVTSDEDVFFMSASVTATINVLRRPTTLTYTGDTNATFGFAQLAAQLSDTRNGAAMGGKTISFAVDGVAVGTATTDATGRAVLASTPASRLGPGEHAIGLSFADDATHAASTATARITIANSVGKVSGDLRTTNGARVTFNVKSEASVTGALDLTTATRTVSVRTWIGLGISSDRKTAVIYGRTAAGEGVVAELTDAGEPGRNDRAIVRFDGASLTGDGALAEGNVQIHK